MNELVKKKILENGIVYLLNGKRHRKGGPAIEHPNGTKHWYLNNKRHRIDGPAIEYLDGTKCWYLNGKLHRVDGPAIEKVDGTKEWWFNGLLHREDGPALIFNNEYSFFINGIEFNPINYFEHPAVKINEIEIPELIVGWRGNFNV